jgi:hypothetical protein
VLGKRRKQAQDLIRTTVSSGERVRAPFTVSLFGKGGKRMKDIEYSKSDGDKFLKIRDHPELFKHFVLPIADVHGIEFLITREELKRENGAYSYADVPGYYGVDRKYGYGSIYVSTEDSFWDRVFKRTFITRCDNAVKRLEEICPELDKTFCNYHDDYLKTVDCVKRYRIKKFSVPKDVCPPHDD